jgi:hypothetical protein
MHFQKRNWKKYNKQLVNRGKIHFWVRAKVIGLYSNTYSALEKREKDLKCELGAFS